MKSNLLSNMLTLTERFSNECHFRQTNQGNDRANRTAEAKLKIDQSEKQTRTAAKRGKKV